MVRFSNLEFQEKGKKEDIIEVYEGEVGSTVRPAHTLDRWGGRSDLLLGARSKQPG
jgi:hypothetical protein